MKTEGLIFAGITAFTAVLGGIYWLTSYEWAGAVLLAFTIGLGVIPGAFLLFHARRSGPGPDSDPDADVQDGAGVVGSFPESSIWPVVIAAGAALAGVGLVFGAWSALPGVILLSVAFVGGALESRSAH